jgi:hypothetical protein
MDTYIFLEYASCVSFVLVVATVVFAFCAAFLIIRLRGWNGCTKPFLNYMLLFW